MITSLANVTLFVKDYDEAIKWYTEKLGLELRMDGSMGGVYRFAWASADSKTCPSCSTSTSRHTRRSAATYTASCFIATTAGTSWNA